MFFAWCFRRVGADRGGWEGLAHMQFSRGLRGVHYNSAASPRRGALQGGGAPTSLTVSIHY